MVVFFFLNDNYCFHKMGIINVFINNKIINAFPVTYCNKPYGILFNIDTCMYCLSIHYAQFTQHQWRFWNGRIISFVTFPDFCLEHLMFVCLVTPFCLVKVNNFELSQVTCVFILCINYQHS